MRLTPSLSCDSKKVHQSTSDTLVLMFMVHLARAGKWRCCLATYSCEKLSGHSLMEDGLVDRMASLQEERCMVIRTHYGRLVTMVTSKNTGTG